MGEGFTRLFLLVVANAELLPLFVQNEFSIAHSIAHSIAQKKRSLRSANHKLKS